MSAELKKVGFRYKDLAVITPYSARFWRREAALGRIPIVKSDQGVMILAVDLDKWLADRRQVKGEESQSETRNQESLAKVSA